MRKFLLALLAITLVWFLWRLFAQEPEPCNDDGYGKPFADYLDKHVHSDVTDDESIDFDDLGDS